MLANKANPAEPAPEGTPRGSGLPAENEANFKGIPDSPPENDPELTDLCRRNEAIPRLNASPRQTWRNETSMSGGRLTHADEHGRRTVRNHLFFAFW